MSLETSIYPSPHDDAMWHTFNVGHPRAYTQAMTKYRPVSCAGIVMITDPPSLVQLGGRGELAQVAVSRERVPLRIFFQLCSLHGNHVTCRHLLWLPN